MTSVGRSPVNLQRLTVHSKDAPTTIGPINGNRQGSIDIGVTEASRRWCGLLFAIINGRDHLAAMHSSTSGMLN
jgi:hypothetical protein